MANFQDAEVVALSARAYVLFIHTLFGVYLWEFFTSIWFEWEFATRVRKLSAASVVYFLARYLTLAALIVAIRMANVIEPLDCKAWNFALYALAFSGVGFTSMLLFLRVIAISKKSKPIIAFFSVFYVAEWLAIIYGIYNSDAEYMPRASLCAAKGLIKHRPNTFVQFAFDFCCLVTMAVFLIRNGSKGGSLRSLMVNQGVVYVACITVAYCIASIFLIANLNDSINQIPTLFALTMMVLLSTRLHRELVTEQSTPSTPTVRPMSLVSLGISLPTARKPKPPPLTIPVPRIQVHRATTATTDDGQKLTEEDLYTVNKLESRSRPGTARRDSEPFADV
ncbi:hypothetical protein EXIGLDRAFT_837560 [Exidia glandulosa HHB12029]|uniref:Uncharacterized protein n=1 Tax=Exidia glandulosa HHB12029 TaxID=1314781 RepID=A0A166ADA9_EXIGL|nr:hypothetical protein EXIGLDRAFT_837560 [Exidia glandulosa HHB12029]